MLFFAFPFAAHSSVTALSVAILLASSTRADTCSNIEPQPIGIDFSQTVVTASYAHTWNNITSLAVITATSDEPYANHIFRLRLEDYEQKNLSRLFEPEQPRETLGQLLVAIGQHCLSKFSVQIPLLDHPAIIAIKNSKVLNWIRALPSRIFDAAKLFLGDHLMKWPDEMTPGSIKDGFVRVLKLLKKDVFETHGMNITFAILSVPDFFNDTINEIVKEACEEVGIETTGPLPRMMMGAWGANTVPDARVLVLDQGKFHLGLRTYQEARIHTKAIVQKYVPLDPFGSAAIDRQLVARVIDNDNILRKQIKLGADRYQLQSAIEKARLLVKDNLDVLIGKSSEGHHHDEWPLDLKDWWIGEEQTADLSWDDVEVVEGEYVDSLSDAIFKFLVVLRRMREKSQDEVPEDIDIAVIMTNHGDGDLLKRAVNQALGRQVETVGGALSDVMLAANGAARAAFKRLESWHKMQRYQAFKQDRERDEL